jgi:hypothetical protein
MSKTSGRLVLTLILTLDPPISYVRCPRTRTGGTPQSCLLLQCHLKSATPWLVVNQPRRPGLSVRSPGQLEHAAFRPPRECSWLASAQSLGTLGQTKPRGRAFESARQRLYGEKLHKASKGGASRLEGEKHVVQHPGKFGIDQPVSVDMLHHRLGAHSPVTGHDSCPAGVAPARWTSAGG